jgi:hypothetical protein
MKKFTLNEEIAKMRKIMGLNEAEDFDLSSVDNPNAYTDDIINHNAERGEGPSHFDFQEAQEIFYNKEVLTDKEAQLVKYFMPKKAEAYLFHRSWDNTYLNLYLYSEADKEEYDFKRETGGFSSEENPIEGMKLNENPVEYTSALGNEIRKNFVMKGGYNGEKEVASISKDGNTILGYYAAPNTENYPVSKGNPLYGKPVVTATSDDNELAKLLANHKGTVSENETGEKKYDQSHGSPYDRGRADSWYQRGKNPHKYPEGTGRGERVEDLTPEEIEAYNAGYDDNERYGDHKEWD